MPNNIQSKINKILTAIRLQGIDIKVDVLEFYSEDIEKYVKTYKVYVKKITFNKKGEECRKYNWIDSFYSKVDLLKCLIKFYKRLKEGEDDGR